MNAICRDPLARLFRFDDDGLHILIQISQQTTLFLSKLPQEIVIGNQLLIQSILLVLLNHRRGQNHDLDASILRLADDFGDIGFVGFKRNAFRSMPNVVHTAGQEHPLRLL